MTLPAHPVDDGKGMTTTRRESITLENDGLTLFGMLHRPRAVADTPRPGVAIFHGLVASKEQPHRIFVKLAEALARVGINALRIDFRGRGDSEGDFLDMTPEGDISDARKALDVLEAQPDVDPTRLGVLGLSWGGAVAACVAGRDERVKTTVLWAAPSTAGGWHPPYQTVDGYEVAEFFGNLIGRQFFDGCEGLQPIEEIKRTRSRVLIVHSRADEAVPFESAQQYVRILAAAGIAHDFVELNDADHALMRSDWERDVLVRTVEWLRRNLAGE
jgi:uncharacterized protein